MMLIVAVAVKVSGVHEYTEKQLRCILKEEKIGGGKIEELGLL